jgi:transketolase
VTKSLREVFGETLVSMGQEDSRLIVIDPDVGNSSRADIFADAFPERFFQVGIAEQNAVAMAAGVASLDFVPWLAESRDASVEGDRRRVRARLHFCTLREASS